MSDTPENEWEEKLQDMLREVAEPREWAHKNRGGAVMDFIRNLRAAAYHRGQEDMKRRILEAIKKDEPDFVEGVSWGKRDAQYLIESLQALKTDSSDNTK